MGSKETAFPIVRACIFDLDGLLINSEDIITECINRLLVKYRRPHIPRDLRARIMGVQDSLTGDLFHDWAKVPIAREEFTHELFEELGQQITNCKPLPGAEKLLSNLSRAKSSSSGEKIELALASSTRAKTYQLKTTRPETKELLDFFAADRRVLLDDPRVAMGRGKPAPDIYLAALESLRATTGPGPGAKVIQPGECLAFEDSVAGVEAARRAGMRVIWVPHSDVAAEWQSRHKDVLAGRSGTSQLGDEWQLGEIDDGWAESIAILEDFDYERYGIQVPI